MKRALLAALLALVPTLAGAGMPTFIANGSANVNASATTCTPTMPGSIVADDILLLVACGEGSDAGGGLALTTANGFAGVGSNNSSDGDALEEGLEIDCRVWWKRAAGGDAAPVVTDSGDHTTCAVHQFRGVKTTGDPWNVSATNIEGAPADTSASIDGATTTANNCLVVLIQGTSNNGTVNTNCGAVTNGDLATITERFDSSNTSGLGGGHCVITGEKASSGTFGASTLTLSTSTLKVAFAVALEGAVTVGRRRVLVVP